MIDSTRLSRPSGTALFVVPDPSYHLVRRRLVGWMFRQEWDDPASRSAAITRWWPRAVAALRSDDEECLTPAPVILFRDTTGTVIFADITRAGDPPHYITPAGRRLAQAPVGPWLLHRTSYASWAEGPLPYFDGELQPASTPMDNPDVQYIRNRNSSLRDLVDRALGPAEYAAGVLPAPDMNHRVGFRIRAVCRRRNLPALESKQSGLLLSVRDAEDE